MGRSNHSFGKRQREADRATKKREKAERRQRKRELGSEEVPTATADEMTGELPSVDEAMQRIFAGKGQRKGAGSAPCRLFVGGLSWDTTAETLGQALGQFGPVSDVFIAKDRATGDSRGFGFVTMADRRDAAKAIDALNGAELEGRTLVVRAATEQ